MTQEKKNLLFKDLCARLRYGVIVNYKEGEYDFHKWKIETLYAPAYSESGLLIETNNDGWIGYTEYEGCGGESASRPLHLDKNLPYLRPMSSMTEEEEEELECKFPHLSLNGDDIYGYLARGEIGDFLEFIYSHHIDLNGLIPMGLALEAPEGMY